ncbi:class I SAM-dependent methyltransferase [Paenibacillus sp. MER TA 81-3]|nr:MULTISPECIES: class I SAM-dependent methyltransferase [unclassified Paenibacillus]
MITIIGARLQNCQYKIDKIKEGMMETKNRSQQYWDESAEVYNDIVLDELNSFKAPAWRAIIEQHIGSGSGLDVLDVGTGPGFFAILLSGMNHTVTAVDSSPLMLKQAQFNAFRAGAVAQFIQGDIGVLPFQEASFDVIISRNVTWTLPQPFATYDAWHRLLRPGGKIVIFDANWNKHLVDEEQRKQYMEDCETARRMGYGIELEESLEREGDEITSKLPLTFEHRPDWDVQSLEKIGYREIVCNWGFDEAIYTESEKVLNRTTPMFSIVAEK